VLPVILLVRMRPSVLAWDFVVVTYHTYKPNFVVIVGGPAIRTNFSSPRVRSTLVPSTDAGATCEQPARRRLTIGSTSVRPPWTRDALAVHQWTDHRGSYTVMTGCLANGPIPR